MAFVTSKEMNIISQSPRDLQEGEGKGPIEGEFYRNWPGGM